TAGADGDAVGLVELGLAWGAVQARGSLAAAAGEVVNCAVAGAVDAHAVVLGVGDQDVAGRVDAEVLRTVQFGQERGAAVARGAFLAGAGHGADLARAVDDPQGVARTLEEINLALAVDGHG